MRTWTVTLSSIRTVKKVSGDLVVITNNGDLVVTYLGMVVAGFRAGLWDTVTLEPDA